MFVSRRFTTKLIEATRSRLSEAADNSNPIARREKNRGAVAAVQAALSDLNKGYLASAEVDGYFGSRTAAAVEAFQRDYGLYADSIVGRQTLMELDHIYSSDLFRDPQGMSMHVGVNKVDPNHYGDSFPLAACVKDANDFASVATGLGYDTVLLLDEEATTGNFTMAIRQAATNLFAGDSLFVTFSGHGSQLTNTSPDAEQDGMDETLCFFDRMMLDDEIHGLLATLRGGVNVTMLYDSCHSATVTRDAFASTDETEGDKKRVKAFREENVSRMTRAASFADPDLPDDAVGDASDTARFVPYRSDELSRALAGDKAKQVSRSVVSQEAVEDIVETLVEVGRAINAAPSRLLKSVDVLGPTGIYARNQPVYDVVKDLIGEQEHEEIACHVVALSACQDNQTTLDGAVNGLYTGNVLSVWAGGGFVGSISQMHSRLRSESPSDITPALNTYGGPRAEARLHERPFAI